MSDDGRRETGAEVGGTDEIAGGTGGSGRKSFNQRLRDRYFGKPRPGADAAEDAAAESSLPKSNQMGFFGRVQRPGGFDRPPEEPVELDGDVPWELGGPAPASRDDDRP